MQGHERSKGMSKSETGLQSLGQGSQKRVRDGKGRAGSSTWSSENRTKVCGWMGYTVGDPRTSLGCGEVWIRVPVQCYTECNRLSDYSEFVSKLHSHFNPFNPEGEAKAELENLHMRDNQKITKYLVEFNRLAAKVQWGNTAL